MIIFFSFKFKNFVSKNHKEGIRLPSNNHIYHNFAYIDKKRKYYKCILKCILSFLQTRVLVQILIVNIRKIKDFCVNNIIVFYAWLIFLLYSNQILIKLKLFSIFYLKLVYLLLWIILMAEFIWNIVNYDFNEQKDTQKYI